MKTFQKLIHDICIHPGVYVDSYNFLMVEAWLSGYDRALYDQGYIYGAGKKSILRIFGLWLSKKYSESHGIYSNFVWSAYFRRLHDDEEALRQLPILFDEFIADCEANGENSQ